MGDLKNGGAAAWSLWGRWRSLVVVGIWAAWHDGFARWYIHFA